MVHSCITIEYNSLQSFRTVYERLEARKMENSENHGISKEILHFLGKWTKAATEQSWWCLQLGSNGLYAPYLPPGRSPDS